MGLRAGLAPPGFDPRTIQPVGSRYTDYATRPTHVNLTARLKQVVFVLFLDPFISLLMHLDSTVCTCLS